MAVKIVAFLLFLAVLLIFIFNKAKSFCRNPSITGKAQRRMSLKHSLSRCTLSSKMIFPEQLFPLMWLANLLNSIAEK